MKDGIERLGPNRYRIRVQARDKRTKRRLSRTETFEGTEAQARGRQKELRAELRGAAAGRKRTRLRDYATSWLERRAPLLKPSVVAKYGNSLLLHILPRLGDVYVDQLVSGDVQQYVADRLADGAAGNTVLNELRLLRVIAKDSVAEGKAQRNWADRVKPPPTRVYDEDDPNMLGAAQLWELLRAVEPQWLPMVSFMAFTGLRWGEASALKWEDLDEAAGVIRIRRGNWKGVLTTPKTTHSKRIVAIPGGMRAEGRAGWIFPAPRGDLYRGTPLNKVMRRACKAAGVRYTTPHGLRRTYNNLLRQVTSALVAKSIIGHATDAMHEGYSLVSAEEKRAAAQRVIDLVESSVKAITDGGSGTATPGMTRSGGATSGTTEDNECG